MGGRSGSAASCRAGRGSARRTPQIRGRPFRRHGGRQFDPGPADGGVVLLRRARVPGGALDAGADQADRCGGADRRTASQVRCTCWRWPNRSAVAITSPIRSVEARRARCRRASRPCRCAALAGVKRVVVVCGHDPSLISASRTAWKPRTLPSAGRSPRARCSRSVRVRVMTAAASRARSRSVRSGRSGGRQARVPRVMWPRRSSRSSTLVRVVGGVPTAATELGEVRPGRREVGQGVDLGGGQVEVDEFMSDQRARWRGWRAAGPAARTHLGRSRISRFRIVRYRDTCFKPRFRTG